VPTRRRVTGFHRIAIPLLSVTAIAISAVPAAAGIPPAWAYGVVRDPANMDEIILPAKDRGNSTGGRVTAEKTEPGSVTVIFAGQGSNGGTVLVTPLTSEPARVPSAAGPRTASTPRSESSARTAAASLRTRPSS